MAVYYCTYRTALRRQLDLLQRLQSQTRQRHDVTNSAKVMGTARQAATQMSTKSSNAVTKPSIFLRLGPLTRTFQSYGRAHNKRPYITQVLTSLVIFACGDVAAQSINGKEYDPIRTVRALIIGGTSAVPGFLWVKFASDNFNFSSRILSILTKVALTQVIWAPLFNTYYFGMQAVLSGATMAEVWERITKTVPPSVLNSMKLWPFVSAFNFAYVPLEFRSVVVGFVAIGWQTYLSYLNREAEKSIAAAQQKDDGRRVLELPLTVIEEKVAA